ncbi:MAG: TetR/AcrR family transcriptional regulator [Thiolinea sp.]
MTDKKLSGHPKKARHRNLLLEATTDIIATEGIAAASVTRICEQAGLSRGMVHLHFANKESLLLEVARVMNARYFSAIEEFLQGSGHSPQEKIEAVVQADLSEVLLNHKSVNIWYAFRGEARSNNGFMKYTDTRDAALRDQLFSAFLVLSAKDNQAIMLARDTTHGTIALLEGMWTDFFLHNDQFNRDTAQRIVFRFLAALYPGNFDQQGALK